MVANSIYELTYKLLLYTGELYLFTLTVHKKALPFVVLI